MHRLSSIPRIRGRDFEKHFFDVNIDVAPIKKKKKKERKKEIHRRSFVTLEKTPTARELRNREKKERKRLCAT